MYVSICINNICINNIFCISICFNIYIKVTAKTSIYFTNYTKARDERCAWSQLQYYNTSCMLYLSLSNCVKQVQQLFSKNRYTKTIKIHVAILLSMIIILKN